MSYWSIYQFYLAMFICPFYFYFSIPMNVEENLVGMLGYLADCKVPIDGFDTGYLSS